MAELVVGAAVGVGTGALKSLVGKLAEALGDEYKCFKEVRGEIKSLTLELEAMHAFLLKKSEDENPDEQDKAWTKEVRELSYDMEDTLDEFMLRVDGKSAGSHGVMDKIKDIIKMTKLRTRRKIAEEIEKLKIQVKEAAERNERYKDRGTIKNTIKLDVDSRALAIVEKASKLLVGIDRPKAKLIKLLAIHEKSESSLKTKVVSIIGSGGLGKTTLASQVYHALKDRFECGAIVSVSRTPDMMKILRTILTEVSNQPYVNTEAGDTMQVVRKISEYLKDKRYLIVIDDIWDTKTWDPINCALFKNNKHSRIITTTRVRDVAKACCFSDGDIVHEMKPLKLADSNKLFLERLFGSDGKCPAHLMDVSNKILKKCDGVPLAIISISGLLANKSRGYCEWNQVLNAIGRGLGKFQDAEPMMQILSLSYFDLPHHLKACLLYLSVFPEDSVIDKWRLVRRWIAEGFIQKEEGSSLYDSGENCFIQLINRSLIRAQKINKHGEVTACQVHDIILDFIVQKSDEENLVTVFGDAYQMHSPDSNKVRRLSLHATSQEKVSKVTELDLSHVRAVTVFDYSVELPLWSKFSFLRVLDLQGCKQVESHHLAAIGKLFQLKYLSLRGTGVCQLPEQIGKLQYLETLEVKESKVTTLPASVAQLPRLACLAVNQGVKLPDEAGSMTALEDLDCVDISNQSICFMQKLLQLKTLRKVSFFLRSANCSYTKEFIVANILVLGDLPDLVFLQVVADDSFEIEGGSLTIQCSDGFRCLRQFEFLCSVPVKFEAGAMPALEKLTLMFLFTSVQIDQVGKGNFPLGIQFLSGLESAYYVASYGIDLIRDWTGEKIVQMEKKGLCLIDEEMADMIYTLAFATCSLLQANLNQDPSTGATSARKTVVHRHQTGQQRCGVGIPGPLNGVLGFIQLIISRVLHCRRPKVLGTEDKELFCNIINTWLEDTSDAMSLRFIQDSAYAATTALYYMD